MTMSAPTAEDMPPTANAITTEILPLATTETCDRCGDGVQGALRVHTPGGELVFCWHHGRQFGHAPAEFDQRHLTERSKGSDH